MPAHLAAALLALHLAGSPHAPPPPPVQPSPAAWDDDGGDLARLGRLSARFDLAVIRRDAALLAAVERRVREELAGELEEARRERRQGLVRRTEPLERAARRFAELEGRTDRRSLDRKRAALAEVTQAAWAELVEVAGGHERWREVREPAGEERWDERAEPRGRDEREGWRPPAPPPPPPAPVVQPLRPERFDALARAMRHEAFGEGKLRILDTALAGPDAWLTVEQLGQLLPQFSFTKEKLELVRHVRPRLLDPQEGWRLYEAFTFDDDKAELRTILEQR